MSIPVVKVRFDVAVRKKKFFALQGAACPRIMKLVVRKTDPDFC